MFETAKDILRNVAEAMELRGAYASLEGMDNAESSGTLRVWRYGLSVAITGATIAEKGWSTEYIIARFCVFLGIPCDAAEPIEDVAAATDAAAPRRAAPDAAEPTETDAAAPELPESDPVRIVLPSHDRMRAISDLSHAIRSLAASLASPAQVTVQNCIINAGGTASGVELRGDLSLRRRHG